MSHENKSAGQLLREFEDMFGMTENGIDPQQNTQEIDLYLQFNIFKILLTAVESSNRVCSDRILEPVFQILGLDDSENLLNAIVDKVSNYKDKSKSLSERKEKTLNDFLGEYEDGLSDPYEKSKWLIRLHQIHRSTYFWACDELKKILERRGQEILDRMMKDCEPTFFHSKLLDLSETFEFGQTEMDIITIYYLQESNDIIDNLLRDEREIRELEKSKVFMAQYLNKSPNEMRHYFTDKAILCRTGILDNRGRRTDLRLNEGIADFLVGLSQEGLTEKFFKEEIFETPPVDLKDHLLKEEHIALMKNLISRKAGCNILLHGEPGTGKTEFVKSLAKSLGKRLFTISSGDDDERRYQEGFRRLALVAAENILNPENSIILVDEADALLNLQETTFFASPNGDKAWVNDFLDNTNAKIIWISNKSRRIERSTRRRFNFTVPFEDFNVKKRKKIWQTQIELNDVDFLDENHIQKLSSKFALNAGQIALTLKDTKSFVNENLMQKESAYEAIETILSHHEDFSGSRKKDFLAIPKAYNANVLNTSLPAEQILKSLKGFQKRLLADELPEDIKNFNLLFYGAPGTGKTEFAKFLAQELGMSLVTKRASDLLSMFVGGSEQNIAQAFKQAERENAILFLDEADSLFINRKSAMRSYETSRTNQLLVEMENFKGVLICSTNFKKELDEAATRRFSQKIYFDTMEAHSKVEFFESYLGLSLPEGELQGRCKAIPNVTPGDFKAVRNRMIFEGLESPEELIVALEEEVAHKEKNAKRIGLAGGMEVRLEKVCHPNSVHVYHTLRGHGGPLYFSRHYGLHPSCSRPHCQCTQSKRMD